MLRKFNPFRRKKKPPIHLAPVPELRHGPPSAASVYPPEGGDPDGAATAGQRLASFPDLSQLTMARAPTSDDVEEPAGLEDDPDLPLAFDQPATLSKRVRAKVAIVLGIVLGCCIVAVGAVLIASADGPTSAAATYHAAVNAYIASGLPDQLAGWSVAVNGTVAGHLSERLNGVGGAPSVSSHFFMATVSTSASVWRAGTAVLLVSLSAGPTATVVQIPLTRNASTARATCLRRYCSGFVAGINSSAPCATATEPYVCSRATLESFCAASFGSTATYTGLASCPGGAPCGTCVFDSRLAGPACIVLKPGTTSDAWVRDASFLSCEYDFAERNYTAVRAADFPISAVDVVIRVSTDPYLALQATTRGTGAFTATPRSLSVPGIFLVVAGGLGVVAGVAGALWLLPQPTAAELEEARIMGLPVRERLKAKAGIASRAARRPLFAVEPRVQTLRRYELAKLRVDRGGGGGEDDAADADPNPMDDREA